LGLRALVGCGARAIPEPRARRATTRPATPAMPQTAAISGGRDAWVGVAVASLWAEPDQARPLDAPSLANPVDTAAWLRAMTVDDRLWLVDRLVTQALYGDRVTVVDIAGGWAKVVVPRQPSKLDSRGYPGWLPTAQLTAVGPEVAASGEAVVDVATTDLIDVTQPDRPPLTLSFNTRLGVLFTGPDGVASRFISARRYLP